MGKTWKAFSWVSVQISMQKSGGLQLMLLKSLYLGKLWFSKTPYSAKYFKLSTILFVLPKRKRLNQALISFSPQMPRLLCNAIWICTLSFPSSISGKKCNYIKYINFVWVFVGFLWKNKLHSGLNFESNLYNDDALYCCKRPLKYLWIEESGPVFSFSIAFIFIEVFINLLSHLSSSWCSFSVMSQGATGICSVLYCSQSF